MELIEAPIGDGYEAYGCKINVLGVDELFRRYEAAGFLYSAKMEQLAPFWEIIKGNWRQGLRGGELIHYVITYENLESGCWGAVGAWRHTRTGWNIQHLVSMGNPHASRAVLLAGQAVMLHEPFSDSQQCWFQPKNRFANRVFGSLTQKIGCDDAALAKHSFLAVGLRAGTSAHDAVRVVCCTVEHRAALCQIASQTRGAVYVQAEELDAPDLELEAVDELYRLVGLRRFRKIWLALSRPGDEPMGAIIAYRGPLGFNFSFLENRCDLLISPALDDTRRALVAEALLQAASPIYDDFLPARLFVATDSHTATCLTASGAQLLREYAQSIWLRRGYEGNYRHTESFYDRMIRAGKRAGDGPKSSGESGGLREEPEEN